MKAEGAKSGKYHTVHCPYSGTCKHGDGELRDHGKINGNPVSLLNTVFFKHVGKTAHLCMKHLVGVNLYVLVRLALPDYGRLVAPPIGQMAVKAIVGCIELPSDKPFNLGFVEICPNNCPPLPVPGNELLCPFPPKGCGIFLCPLIMLPVLLHALDMGSHLGLSRGTKYTFFREKTLDGFFAVAHCLTLPSWIFTALGLHQKLKDYSLIS